MGYQKLSQKDAAFDFCKKVSLSKNYTRGFLKLPKTLRTVVRSVFPNEFGLAYALADNFHRHAWNIFLHRCYEPMLLANADDGMEVREKLIRSSPKSLVKEAGLPPCILTILRHADMLGYGCEFYDTLGDLLTKTPNLLRQLMNEVWDEKLVMFLSVLPEPVRDTQFAQNFGDVHTYVRFMDIYGLVTGRSSLSKEHVTELRGGMQHYKLLRKLVYAMDLFAGVLPDNDRIRHLSNWKAVDAAARAYNNCLRSMFDEVMSNAMQVYEIKLCDNELCVVALKNEGVLGWVFSEAKLFQNEDLDDDQMNELLGYLSEFGVTRTNPIQAIVRGHYESHPF